MRAIMRVCLYLLTAYPVIDYVLHVHPLTIFGEVWDKVFLLGFAWYAWLDRPHDPYDKTQKAIVYVVVLGIAFLLLDVGDLNATFAGFRDDYTAMLFVLVMPYVMTKDDLVPLLKWVVMIGFLIAIHGVYQYIVKIPNPAAWADPLQHERTRVYSIFGSPNILGSYMAFIAPLAAGLALYEQRRGPRLYFALAALASALTLLFTFTRGAWVAFFVGTLVFTWLINRRLTIAVLVLAVLGVAFVHPITSRVTELFNPVYLSKEFANGRIARWINAYDQMRTSPLFGVGMGHYGGAVASQYFGVIYVDNYYAKTLAETGIVGLLALLSLFAIYLRQVFLVWKKATSPQLRYVLAGVVSSLTVLIVHNAMENVFEEAPMYLLFWLVGTAALVYGRQELSDHA